MAITVNVSVISVVVLCLLLADWSTETETDEAKSAGRILEKDLSGQTHYQGGSHNSEYDHEAFLGDEAKTFDQLSPQESKKRLGLIVDKIDTDGDGLVTQEELTGWIKYTQRKYVRDNVERSWRAHNPNNTDQISWEDYSNIVYDFMKNMGPREMAIEEDGMSYKTLYDRDLRRWHAADLNQDSKLTKEEFLAFLHPEEVPTMRDLVTLETMEEIDKDKDGKISLNEYIGDMYQSEGGEEKPEWVVNEMEHFARHRDQDGDGYLNIEEVKEWIDPQGFDHADTEARHLIREADKNNDERLTKEEILEKFDLFVGSQATDFGEVLLRHDEF